MAKLVPQGRQSSSSGLPEHCGTAAISSWAATHNALPRLPNRGYFQEQLEETICAVAFGGHHAGLLLLHVDNFKQINDALGHDAGDALLATIAGRLADLIDGFEFTAHPGEVEFAIVIPETGARALGLVERVLAALKEPLVYRGCDIECRMSIGATIFPDHGSTLEDVLKSADAALYPTKMGGRARALPFQPGMRSEIERRGAVIGRAQDALARDAVFPFYQPKILLRTGAVIGFEALLRWRDTDEHVRTPTEIDAAFDDLEVAQALSDRMQDFVIADLRRWLDAGVNFGRIALNAADVELRRSDFADRLLNKLEAAAVPTACLELEVTETVFLGNGADHVGSTLQKLSAHGVRLALDDFGTGYASLSHLKNFPVDVIKIDKSFVGELGHSRSDTAIVLALLGLAADLGLEIVAEGIETEAQRSFLANHGCDLGQGYLFGRPGDAQSVIALLDEAGRRSRGAGDLFYH